jgi:RNA polymerase sigma-70 factor (ECF subfamily)
MVEDAALAEDLTQECFLRVWRARHTYRPTAAFRTWLFTIARRLALDALKRPRVEVAPLDPEIGEGASGPLAAEVVARLEAADPEQAALARALEQAVETALSGMAAELREVVLLRDTEGLTYDEIAAIAGCPVGTVKSRLNAARARLRAAARKWLEAE